MKFKLVADNNVVTEVKTKQSKTIKKSMIIELIKFESDSIVLAIPVFRPDMLRTVFPLKYSVNTGNDGWLLCKQMKG